MSAKWDRRGMNLAIEARTWSKDPKNKVGCAIVSPDRRLFTIGYNGFPRNIADTLERLNDKDQKNRLMVHAELNAILNARRDLTNWTLYSSRCPCGPCALAITQAGVIRMVAPRVDGPSSWASSQMEALEILRKADITIEHMEARRER